MDIGGIVTSDEVGYIDQIRRLDGETDNLNTTNASLKFLYCIGKEYCQAKQALAELTQLV